MQGRTHTLSGAVTGATTSLYALHLSPAPVATFTLLAAGAALLPDLDHPRASLAHSFGFATRAFAWLVGKVSGGHRHGTHSLLGVAAFTAAAWAAATHQGTLAGRIGLGVLLALVLGGAAYGAGVKGHLADLLAIAGAVALVVTSWGLALVPLAVALGCATHLAGDMMTDHGCPLAWPLSVRRAHLPEPFAFTVGTKPEAVVGAVLLAALLLVGSAGLGLVTL